jgi:hypothetical protein
MDKFTESARRAAIRELIAVRAYELWETQGRPHGRHEVNWRQAEQEILGCIGDFQPVGGDRGQVGVLPPEFAAFSGGH